MTWRDPALTTLALGDYRCDANYRVVRRHGARNWLLFATEAGGGCIRRRGVDLRCRPGSIIAIAPEVAQDYFTDPAIGTWVFAWAHFKPPSDWLPLLAWPEALPGVRCAPPPEAEVLAQVLRLLREGLAWEVAGGLGARTLASLRLQEALVRLARAQAVSTPLTDSRLEDVCAWVAAHPAASHSIASLAARAGWSPDHFAHRFTAVVGRPPLAWVEEVRLRAAARLLERPGARVAAVAAAVGFRNAGHFATRFRRWSGLTPRAWSQREAG